MPSIVRKLKRRLSIVFTLILIMLFSLPFTASADDEMDEDSIFISIRRYPGVDRDDMAETTRLIDEGFLPIMRMSEGFIGYFILPGEDVYVAISLFETEEQATASNEAARDFVAEFLAPFLTNPPLIVEGSVDIMVVEMLSDMDDETHDDMESEAHDSDDENSDEMDDMSGDGVSSLYAALRIYNNFDLAYIDQANELLQTMFVPIQQEAEGFFGYIAMNDGVDTVAGFSIYDSEENALAVNEKVADFLAEYMAEWLPEDPFITNGRLGVAALAGLHDGANLIDDMMDEDRAFASIRVYDGVDASDRDEIVRLADEGFLPIMRESDGFVGYFLLQAGDVLAAISLFETAEQASASAEAAREFVAEFMVPLLPNVPLIIEGRVDVSTQMLIKVHDPDDLIGPLYGALRIYDNYDMSRLDDANELVETILVPSLQEAGVFSYVSMNDGDDHVVGLSVFGSEESALAANNIAASFVAEHLADWLPNDPMRINGRMSVVARAEILMGENLAEWTMMDADMESEE